jgi:Tol biopolymer transport system component
MGPSDAMAPPDPSAVPVTLDAGVAPIEDCVLGEFQAPELLTGIEQGLNPELTISLWSPSLSADGLTLFFGVSSGADEQIATATRADRDAAFGRAVGVPEVSTAGQNGTPALSADGLTLYFYSTRGGGLGSRDLWLSTRSDTAAEFTTPNLIAGVNGPDFAHGPWISPDELTLIWATDRSGGVGQGDIWIARRSFRTDGFSGVAPLNGVNSPSDETRAVIDNDGLTIYLSSNRPGGVGGRDLWVATRYDPAGSFSRVTNLAAVNSSSEDTDPALSADGRELMFASARDGRTRLWRSVRDCE